MASSQIHVRSISLPSRLTNSTDFEVELQKLKSNCQICITLPIITSEAIQSGLVGLAELYNSVEELITQSRSHHQDAKTSMEESLSESAELLDSCSIIRELFQMMKENVQSLQSALRRKGLSDPSILHSDITTYFCYRKKLSKCAAKTLKTLKNLEHKITYRNLCSELTGVTIAILKSILVLLSLPKSLSFVSKLMPTKSGRENGVTNEVGNVDFALKTIQGKLRSRGSTAVDELQKTLQNLDTTIQGFEGGLERLNRQLVQSRVILLNLLTDC